MFHIISTPTNHIILGFPWLQTHNPVLSWKEGELISWSLYCQHHCLRKLQTRPCLKTTNESPDSQVNISIPQEYQDLWEVISKEKSRQLPPHGYDHRVMPYGLTNAPAAFQSFIHEIFRNMLHQYVIAYIDDILIYSSTYKDTHVRTILNRLLTHQLYVKVEKCTFHEDYHISGLCHIERRSGNGHWESKSRH
ncbi:hypothetical protein QTP70_013579 [Hemibagrus guttatus]|uniref:ribonuclease H n=1 Tax=Hemibagrus guttatus TaxID=175788 RepID=A0AAE0RDR0_9TELE|nr:hypothetical protein QTP70_013579 [Hemibagrus guttatus]